MNCYICNRHKGVVQTVLETKRGAATTVTICEMCNELKNTKISVIASIILLIMWVAPAILYWTYKIAKRNKIRKRWESYYLEHGE